MVPASPRDEPCPPEVRRDARDRSERLGMPRGVSFVAGSAYDLRDPLAVARAADQPSVRASEDRDALPDRCWCSLRTAMSGNERLSAGDILTTRTRGRRSRHVGASLGYRLIWD